VVTRTDITLVGINTPDHDNLFTQIASRLIRSSLPSGNRTPNYVALLQSRDCSNLRITMRNMIEQFLGSEVEYEDADEEDDILDEEEGLEAAKEVSSQLFSLNTSRARRSRLPNYDMQILDGWYRHVVKSQSSSFSLPNLVVIIQDFESFDPSILEDLFEICR
jgi:origin recognition complex subunit 3